MTIKREFLGRKRPALVATAEYLRERFAGSSDLQVDLRGVVVVVPGARAGRRLLEILVDQAAADERSLVPPRISTPAQLPELLYPAKKPFAGELVQQLVWADSLRRLDAERLGDLIAERPGERDFARWLELGRLLQRLHRELASDALDFSDALRTGQSLPGFAESRRWETLADVQRMYLDELDRLGLWDRQTARLVAIDHGECRLDKHLVLAATVDLNQAMREMLDQVDQRVAGQENASVTALIHAPREWAERFDAHGCLAVEAWQDVPLEIPDEVLLEAGGPAEQSEQVVRRIADFQGRYRAEELTIGLPDETILPQLARQLDECGLPNRFGPGLPLTSTAVYRLLEDLAALLDTQRYAEFARWVRHPDVEHWLLREGVEPGWIEELDAYHNEHLPRAIDGQWLGKADRFSRLRAVQARVAELIAPLQGTARLPGTARPLDAWLPAIGHITLAVYGGRTFDLEHPGDRRTWRACQALRETLDELAEIPASVRPVLAGAEALRLVLDQLGGQRIAPASDEAAIELVGWLELPLDDAPGLIVTSFNEGFVPSSVSADMFLPGAFRSALGLDDNEGRYARDAYAVATLLAPWRETTLIVGRRTGENDPLAPSRLLFAAPPEKIVERSLRFFAEEPRRPVRPPLPGGLRTDRRQFAFQVPRPRPLTEPLTRMSVTAFRSYLQCPYRFYLSHILRLQHVDDDLVELDGALFGNLAHDVLESFGRGDTRDCTEAETIEIDLNQRLSELVRARLGTRPGTALLVQIEQLRLRLRAFARWQAAWAGQGWRIEHTELSFTEQPGRLEVDGKVMHLTGRIDRIDVHEATGQRVIFDYKTGDSGTEAEKAHRRKSGEWIDLQLPLYRHLVRALGIDPPLRLGYLLLPKSTAKVGPSEAQWTEEDLAAADATARSVVRRIWAEEFWPPVEPPPDYSEDFAGICMDGVFGKNKAAPADPPPVDSSPVSPLPASRRRTARKESGGPGKEAEGPGRRRKARKESGRPGKKAEAREGRWISWHTN